jgi:H+-translocating NAD(P) transhydrogenase subunit alpha
VKNVEKVFSRQLPHARERDMSTPAELLKQAQDARDAAVSALAKADAAIGAIKAGAVSAASATATAAGIDPIVFQFAIFVLAIFVGYYVVWSVTPALHTPLMSVTNAISSVIVVGALLAVGVNVAGGGWAQGFGFVALILAAVNIFGGFLVTQRMLAMYKKKA